MRTAKLSFLILMILAGTVQGLFSQTVKLDYQEFNLPNGLHVILHEDHSTPIVTVSVMYHVGSKNELTGRTGFAHLFEHLMFEGSDNIPRGEYTRFVEKAGGTLNANTAFDRTYYYEVLPSNQVEIGLWLESERMLHAKIDSIGIATQKGVVIEEIKQREENQPYGSLLRETFGRAYTVHPYHTPTLGRADDLRASTDQDVLNFYKTFYVPNNAVLVLAGDINPKSAKKLVNKYFGDIPMGARPITRPPQNEPVKTAEIRDTVYDNIQLPAIIQAYHVPAMGTRDYFAVSMLNSILSDGQSSRFNKALVDEKQLSMQAVSFPLPLEHPGITLALLIPNIGVDLTTLEAAADEEISKLQNELVPEEEFQKLKNKIEADMINRLSGIESRAELLATGYTYYNNTGSVNTDIDNYLKVTREDIREAARKYFRKDNRVVLYYLPKTK
ncbi:MAG: pitrilysin family protein [Bacteroidales bacterium]|nr:pitrilysin family protein [Bacteroidales bacterium]